MSWLKEAHGKTLRRMQSEDSQEITWSEEVTESLLVI